MSKLKEKVQKLIDDFINNHPDLFLVELKISSENKIEVYIDGDESVSVQNCLDASRAIEFSLDREEEDFSLEVSSPGLNVPLKLIRQYKKNIGRDLEITLQDEQTFTGTLIQFQDDSIELQWSEKRKKEIGKGNETIILTKIVELKDIKKAMIALKF